MCKCSCCLLEVRTLFLMRWYLLVVQSSSAPFSHCLILNCRRWEIAAARGETLVPHRPPLVVAHIGPGRPLGQIHPDHAIIKRVKPSLTNYQPRPSFTFQIRFCRTHCDYWGDFVSPFRPWWTWCETWLFMWSPRTLNWASPSQTLPGTRNSTKCSTHTTTTKKRSEEEIITFDELKFGRCKWDYHYSRVPNENYLWKTRRF